MICWARPWTLPRDLLKGWKDGRMDRLYLALCMIPLDIIVSYL
jgi:hypothetical protein